MARKTEKDLAAVSLGARGGKARAKALTAEERSEISSKAGKAGGRGRPKTRETGSMPDFTRADKLTPEIEAAIDEAFDYRPWVTAQQAAGREIRIALADAVKAIVANAPPCPDRSAAIRKIREASMDANSAITHGGKY